MSPKNASAKKPAEQLVKDIRRATRRHFSAEDKIRIVLDVRAQPIRGMGEHDHCAAMTVLPSYAAVKA